MRKPSIGLFGRVIFVVMVALGAMLVSFAVSGLQAVGQSTERTMQERRMLAQVIAGRVDDRLNETVRVIQVMIATEAIDPESNDRAAQEKAVQDIRRQLGSFAYWVALIDAQNNLITADPPLPEVQSFNFSASKCMPFVRGNKLPAISGALPLDSPTPTISSTLALGTPTPAVTMLIPTFRNGEISGIVFAALDLTTPQFTDLLAPLGLGTTGVVEVIDRNGLILGASKPELAWQTDDYQDRMLALIANNQATVGGCHNCHATASGAADRRDDIMAFVPLTATRGGVVVRQSRAEAFVYGDELARQIVLLGAVTFLLAAGLTWFLVRQWVKPLQGLTQICKEIAVGRLSVPIPLRGPGEIGTLAKALDAMQRQLRASLDEIQKWTTELEERVRQRTREVEESRTQLLQVNRELMMLNTLSNAMRQSVDLEATLDVALEQVITLGNAWGASICLLDRPGERYVATPERTQHLKGQPPCDWAPVRAMIDQAPHDGHTQVFRLPVVQTPDHRIALNEGAELHPVVCVPLTGRNRTLGVLVLVNPRLLPIGASGLDLLTSIGGQIGIAVENAILFDALKEKEEARTQLLRKTIAAQEEERQRIARELHDETSQTLTALSVGLKTAIMAPAQSPEEVRCRLGPLEAQATGMLVEIQRMIRDLRPSLLDDLGLITAIDWYAQARLKAQGIHVEWEVAGTEKRLPHELEIALFRVAQEAISNIARHAAAENVSIVLGFADGQVTLEIEDDGRGFDVADTLPGVRVNTQYGLAGMRERVSLFDGEFLIESQLGQGTRIQAKIPINHNGHA